MIHTQCIYIYIERERERGEREREREREREGEREREEIATFMSAQPVRSLQYCRHGTLIQKAMNGYFVNKNFLKVTVILV